MANSAPTTNIPDSRQQPLTICPKLLSPDLIIDIKEECDNEDYWHKFMVQGVQPHYSRQFVLKTILDFVQPSNLFPIHYECTQDTCVFLARNCLEAILKIVSTGMLIPIQDNSNMPLRIVTIIGNFQPLNLLKIDIKDNIIEVLKKRLKQNKLNLSGFHHDIALKEFCIFAQPKLMRYVLYLVANLNPEELPTQIDLSSNYIKVLHPIQQLNNLSIHSLDLSYNEIENLEDLSPLSEFTQLNELILDGNPLCDKFNDPYAYIRAVREYCPHLLCLDTVRIFDKNGIPPTKQHFLCSLEGGDLVNQFCEYFFTVYDYEDRTRISDLYHENATLSISCNQLEQHYTRDLQLQHYFDFDRNLCCPTSKLQHYERFIQGRKNIMKIFREWPRTNHDPLQLTCSLMYYTDKNAVLSVCGTFKENHQSLTFMRNFVLESNAQGYCILNDQLHVHNSLLEHFQASHTHPANVEISYNPLPYYNVEYEQVLLALNLITGLNYNTCRWLLERNYYDLKRTLNQFLEMYFEDWFPPEVFIQEGLAGLVKSTENNTTVKINPYPKSIVENIEKMGLRASPKMVWMEINSCRIAVDFEAKEKMLDNMNNKILVEEPVFTFNARNPQISLPVIIQLQNQSCNADTNVSQSDMQSSTVKLTRSKRKRRGVRKRKIESSRKPISLAKCEFVKNNESQQCGLSAEYCPNESPKNPNDIIDSLNINQPDINQDVKQNIKIEISSPEDSLLPGVEEDCHIANHIAKKETMGLMLQSCMSMTPVKIPSFTFHYISNTSAHSPATQNIRPTSVANKQMELPWEVQKHQLGGKLLHESSPDDDPTLPSAPSVSAPQRPSKAFLTMLADQVQHNGIWCNWNPTLMAQMQSLRRKSDKKAFRRRLTPTNGPPFRVLVPALCHVEKTVTSVAESHIPTASMTRASTVSAPSVISRQPPSKNFLTMLADQMQNNRKWQNWDPTLMSQMQALRQNSSVKKFRRIMVPTTGPSFEVTIPAKWNAKRIYTWIAPNTLETVTSAEGIDSADAPQLPSENFLTNQVQRKRHRKTIETPTEKRICSRITVHNNGQIKETHTPTFLESCKSTALETVTVSASSTNGQLPSENFLTMLMKQMEKKRHLETIATSSTRKKICRKVTVSAQGQVKGAHTPMAFETVTTSAKN